MDDFSIGRLPGESEFDGPAVARQATDFLPPRWYAASTRARHEKTVAEQLSLRSVEHFLPLYESVRQWKDRRVRLQLPLFPGYVFVRMTLRDRLRVLQVPSVGALVSFNGVPAALPETEIEALRVGLARGVQAVPHPYLKAGRRVRIVSGPLHGLEGIVVREKSGLRFVLSLELIGRATALEIEGSALEAIM